MTKEQIGEYKGKIDSYMGDFAPDEVVTEYKRRTTRTPKKEVTGQTVIPGESATAGAPRKEGIEPGTGKEGASVKPKPIPKQQAKPQDEPDFWENNLSGLDVTGRRGNLEPVIRAYIAGKMTEQGLRSALDLAGLEENSVNEWIEFIKGFKK
jgi:hypothetical protein